MRVFLAMRLLSAEGMGSGEEVEGGGAAEEGRGRRGVGGGKAGYKAALPDALVAVEEHGEVFG